ncbi:MAG: response regulator [Magnetococcales bacterium]|nr:response regulator [Magnetococcales bacterium]
MNERLLIVDDDEFMRLVTQEVLEQAGYQVEVARDGMVAWEALEAAPARFDLILLDRQMPRMDGMTLLQRIKADHRFMDLPVVLLTGLDRQQEIVEGLAAGAYYYLTKPSPEDVLQRVIKNALHEARQKEELRTLAGQKGRAVRLLRRGEFYLQNLQEAKDMALLLAEASQDPVRTVSGYSELLINAIEHGNLGIGYEEKSQLLRKGTWREEVNARLQRTPYRDRLVSVVVDRRASVCIVTITDQGGGFAWENYLQFSPERAFDLHGRGIALSKVASFDEMEYLGNGSTVITRVNMVDGD